MVWVERQSITTMLVLFTTVLLPAGPTSSAELYFHRSRACTRCSIPRHHYGHDIPRYGASEFAVANAAIGTGELRHKPFHFRALALRVDQLTLDQVGLAIYESNGKLIATGRITHNGGDGGLIGNNVRIRVRAYVSSVESRNQVVPLATTSPQPELLPPPNDGTLPAPPVEAVPPSAVVTTPAGMARIPADAFVVFESEHNLWVSRGRPESISLVPVLTAAQAEKLQKYFSQITHLEVDMEFVRDR